MKISSILQTLDLLIMLGLGLLLGIFYGILNVKNTIKENILSRIICDIIFIFVATSTYILAIQKINLGSLRLYLFAGYIIGFFIERISLGKLFAKGYKSVYNKMKIMTKSFINTKLGKIIFK